jgi:hypothetical protein
MEIIALIGYLVIAVVLSYLFYRRDIKALSSHEHHFKKHAPFLPYGDIIMNFQYVFQHNKNILGEVLDDVIKNVTQKTKLASIKGIEFIDTDKKLSVPDKREFYLGSCEPTIRGSKINTFIYHDQYGEMQNFQWWILINNPIKRSRVVIFLLLSFITFPFRLISYIKGSFNIAAHIRSPYEAFNEDLDLIMQIRSIHETIINALVESLESHGIDTSDLKAQKAQSININVSGGKTTFGNVMQGAMNKVSK